MKRVFIIHGWGGRSDVGWLLWLQQELKKKGFEAHGLNMPNTMNPTVAGWIGAIKKAVGAVDENTFFVGHSLGCISICRFLEQQKNKAGGVVLVAGFYHDFGVPELKEFNVLPLDLKKARNNMKHCTIVASDDDPKVSLSVAIKFGKELNAKEIVQHKQGHFMQCPTLPVVLDELIKMS